MIGDRKPEMDIPQRWLRAFRFHLLVMTLLLTACGGGETDDGGNGFIPPTPPPTVSLSGAVLDDPVANALVTAFDENGVQQGQVQSDASGWFEMGGLAQSPRYRLVTQGGTVKGQAFIGTMTAWCTQSPCHVTPFTSLAALYADLFGISYADAIAQLLSRLGYGADPFVADWSGTPLVDLEPVRLAIAQTGIDAWLADFIAVLEQNPPPGALPAQYVGLPLVDTNPPTPDPSPDPTPDPTPDPALPPVATPVLNPTGGYFTGPITVAISTATAGATLRYTLDGTTPTETSPTYSAPLAIDPTVYIRVRGFKDDHAPSAIGQGLYIAGYTVGGAVSGIGSTGLRLSLNGIETLPVAISQTPTTFVFDRLMPTNSSYSVTVAAQPPDAYCEVAGGQGVISGANVVDISVQCVPFRSLSITMSGHGEVTSQPPGIDCTEACRAEFGAGRTVVLSAQAAANNVFTGWAGECYGEGLAPSCTVVLDGDLQVAANFETLFVKAAPQDSAVFLTWNVLPGTTETTLYWRETGTSTWAAVSAARAGRHLLTELPNYISHEFYVRIRHASGRLITSHVVRQTPRPRTSAHPTYMAWDHLNQWLTLNGINPLTLTLRSQQITADMWQPDAPNGIYRTPSGQGLLLFRSFDTVFVAPTAVHDAASVRATLKRRLWPDLNPFDNPEAFDIVTTELDAPLTGSVDGLKYQAATSWKVQYHPWLSSPFTRFIPVNPVPGRVAIYAEGHAGLGVDLGPEFIERLLDDGWEVYSTNMPLYGPDAVTPGAPIGIHEDFARLDEGADNPVGLFLLSLKTAVDRIHAEQSDSAPPIVILIGRSGGGWTSILYGALDSRLAVVSSVAGAVPISQRLSAGNFGDYEQHEPTLFEVVGYEDMMAVAGKLGAYYVYNGQDPCCFRVLPGNPFPQWMEDVSPTLQRPINVYLDAAHNEHNLSGPAYIVFQNLLNDVIH